MAVSKNNRKKKTKRTQNHSAPKVEKRLTEAQKQEIIEKQEQDKKHLKLSIIACIIMVVGFAMGWAGYELVGYPISFAGGVMGLVVTHKQGKSKRGRVTIICYTIYCVLIAYMWIFKFLAN